MNIKLFGASLGIVLISFTIGLIEGVRFEREQAEERANREDVFDQFVDILADSLDEDGEVWYGD